MLVLLYKKLGGIIMFIYESHMGGLFASETEYDEDSLYCDTCGDSDILIGEANNKEELLNLLTYANYTYFIDIFSSEKSCVHNIYASM